MGSPTVHTVRIMGKPTVCTQHTAFPHLLHHDGHAHGTRRAHHEHAHDMHTAHSLPAQHLPHHGQAHDTVRSSKARTWRADNAFSRNASPMPMRASADASYRVSIGRLGHLSLVVSTPPPRPRASGQVRAKWPCVFVLAGVG